MKKVAFIILLLAFLIFSVSLISYFYGDLETREFYTSVNITDSLGFDVNGSALTFGNIPFLGSSTRSFNFENNYDFPVLVKINVDGEISPFLSFEDNIRVESGKSEKIIFAVSSNGAERKFYEGIINFRIRRTR